MPAPNVATEEKRIKSVPYKPESPDSRIVKAGRALFFEHGFTRVSTDMIAKEASVSKATLYKYFPSMVEVLKAVTAVEAESFEAGTITDVNDIDELRDALVTYGTNLMRFLNDPEIIQFSQMMFEEAREHPDIAAEFYNAAYGRGLRRLSSMFEQAIDKGFFEPSCTPTEVSEQLLGMWEGLPFTRALMGVTKRPFPRPKEWCEKCVDQFLSSSI
ncbi:MAG: TetR/AcrR family transcriptional regulator [Pseudomonadota bacterium]